MLRRPGLPVTTTRTGSVSSASAATLMWVASGELAFATTAARSAGTSTVPRGAWPAASVPTRTPSGDVTAYSTAPSSVGVSVSSERSRSTGVNRHSSSRPFGIGNAATSNDVGRSARDWSGTNAAPESVCAPLLGPPVSPAVFSNSGISRLLLPSAAR